MKFVYNMLIISRDKNRDIQQEYNSRSISLTYKTVDTTEFISHCFMETAGVEPLSAKDAETAVFLRVYTYY